MTTNGQLIIMEYLPAGVAKLVLNNPPMNLNSLALTDQLEKALLSLAQNNSVRAIVITGAGSKAFCAGSDIKEFPRIWDDAVGKKLKRENMVFDFLERLEKPVIAAIEGIACGGGCELALACDLRIMAENAKIGLPEINIGVIPASGGLFRLPKIVGTARALELMFLGNFISAAEALNIGLINRIATEGKSVAAAVALAEEISGKSLECIKAIKRGVKAAVFLSPEEALKLNHELSDQIFKSESCREGFSAFTEKRPPRFKSMTPAENK